MRVMTPLLQYKEERRRCFLKYEIWGMRLRRPLYRSGMIYRSRLGWNPYLFPLKHKQLDNITPIKYRSTR